ASSTRREPEPAARPREAGARSPEGAGRRGRLQEGRLASGAGFPRAPRAATRGPGPTGRAAAPAAARATPAVPLVDVRGVLHARGFREIRPGGLAPGGEPLRLTEALLMGLDRVPFDEEHEAVRRLHAS